MKKSILFSSAFLLVFFTSCGTYVYKSVTPKTPFFREQNDFRGELNVGPGGGEIYTAYSPFQYIGVSAAFSGYQRKEDSAAVIPEKRFKDFELAVVPYYPYQNVRFEMPAGIGFTSFKSSTNGFKAYTPYNRMFLQPTVGFCWENFEMGLLMRITQVDYTYERWGTDIRYEPGIMIRGGSKNVKAMLQFRTDSGTNYSRSVAAHLPPENQVLYMPFHFSFGVHFDLNFSKEKTTGNALPHLVF